MERDEKAVVRWGLVVFGVGSLGMCVVHTESLAGGTFHGAVLLRRALSPAAVVVVCHWHQRKAYRRAVRADEFGGCLWRDEFTIPGRRDRGLARIQRLLRTNAVGSD